MMRTIDHHTAEIIPLRRRLQASLDLISVGGAICEAGGMMTSAGTAVMQLNELPTEHMIRELSDMGWHLVRCAAALEVARATVELPADCERSE